MNRQYIFLNISEIASFIGKNPYDYHLGFERLWKKYDNDYIRCLNELNNNIVCKNDELKNIYNEKNIIEQQQKTGIISEIQFNKKIEEINVKQQNIENIITNSTQHVENISYTPIQKIEKELGNTITKTIASSSKETTDKRKITNKAIDTLVKTGKIKQEQKQELLKQTNSLINQTHGILKEDDAIKIFEQRFNVILDTSQKYYKYEFANTTKFSWFIGGKMDGLFVDTNPENNYVVEIKNRVKGFFNSLRDYELVQIQLYLLLTQYNEAKLVEKYNSKIKITIIKKDQEYIDNIIQSLNIFIHHFELFLNNYNMKMDYINLNENNKKKFLNKLYIDEINKLYREKAELIIIQNQTEQDCLIDDFDDL